MIYRLRDDKEAAKVCISYHYCTVVVLVRYLYPNPRRYYILFRAVTILQFPYPFSSHRYRTDTVRLVTNTSRIQHIFSSISTPLFQADFSSAAALGSPFARMQLAMMNPYAAMCNAALAKVMGDLKGGQ